MFTDVTLVSGDGFKLEAHKTVLSSSSSFFKDILIENQHTSVLLYMRGVTHKELELLLEFTYTGECQVEAGELESFLRTGKELGVQGLLELENTMGKEVSRMIPVKESSKVALPAELKREGSVASNLKAGFGDGLSTNIEVPLDSNMEEDTIEDSSPKELKSDFDKGQININMELTLDDKSDHVAVLDDKTLRECFDRNPTERDEKKSLEIEWKCVRCSISLLSEQKLKTHMAKKHETEVLCKTCGFKTFSSALLGRHQRVHGGFICNQCSFQSTNRDYLKRHKEIKHDGLRFQCDRCTSSYTEKRKLGKHMKSVHE